MEDFYIYSQATIEMIQTLDPKMTEEKYLKLVEKMTKVSEIKFH